MGLNLVTLLDLATDIMIYGIFALTLRATYSNKSTRTLFSISLWGTWATITGLLLLPAEYSRIIHNTLAMMTGLLFLTSQEYRSNKAPKAAVE